MIRYSAPKNIEDNHTCSYRPESIMNANQLSVITMQNKDSDLNVQGMDQGLSFHSPISIDSAGIVSRAFIIG
jgi:hypothetical protein